MQQSSRKDSTCFLFCQHATITMQQTTTGDQTFYLFHEQDNNHSSNNQVNYSSLEPTTTQPGTSVKKRQSSTINDGDKTTSVATADQPITLVNNINCPNIFLVENLPFSTKKANLFRAGATQPLQQPGLSVHNATSVSSSPLLYQQQHNTSKDKAIKKPRYQSKPSLETETYCSPPMSSPVQVHKTATSPYYSSFLAQQYSTAHASTYTQDCDTSSTQTCNSTQIYSIKQQTYQLKAEIHRLQCELSRIYPYIYKHALSATLHSK